MSCSTWIQDKEWMKSSISRSQSRCFGKTSFLFTCWITCTILLFQSILRLPLWNYMQNIFSSDYLLQVKHIHVLQNITHPLLRIMDIYLIRIIFIGRFSHPSLWIPNSKTLNIKGSQSVFANSASFSFRASHQLLCSNYFGSRHVCASWMPKFIMRYIAWLFMLGRFLIHRFRCFWRFVSETFCQKNHAFEYHHVWPKARKNI